MFSVAEILKLWKDLGAKFKNRCAEENSQTTGSAAAENSFPYCEHMMFLKPALQYMAPLSSLTAQVNNPADRKRKCFNSANAGS